MRILPSLALIASLIAAPVWAQDQMSAQDFDAYSKGKTFYYGSQGKPYGVEEYFNNQRVRWSFLNGQCQEGRWYEDQGAICFVYENTPTPQCWRFFRSPEGMTAQFEGEDGALTELYQMQDAPEAMQCPGPEVGV